jgi:uncharacterized protein YbaP (TraB family)
MLESMPKLAIVLLQLTLLSLACATPDVGPQAAATPRVGVVAPGQYVNDVLGVRLTMPEDWVVFSDAETAPPGLSHQLAQRAGPRAGVQMMGLSADGSAFVMLTAVPAVSDIRTQLDALVAASGDAVQSREAWISEARRSARWHFSTNPGGADLTFFDTTALVEGAGLRLSFWTFSPLFERKRAEFEAISERVELREDGEWNRRWEGLEASLSSQGLEHMQVSPRPEPSPRSAWAECPVPDRHLLWRVRAGESVVHLFGSIHIGRPEFYPLAPLVEESFAASDRLVVEVDMSSPGVAEQSLRMMERGRIDDGRTLREELGPEMYEALAAAFQELGLPLERFEEMQPWSLALMLSMLKLQNLGYLPAYGVESYLLDRVGDRTIIELESAEQQLALFESLDGAAFLAYTLDSLDTVESQSREMMSAWMCGDDEALAELLLGPFEPELPGAEEFYEKVFYERNLSMADSIEVLLGRPGTYFVLVGAGHLVGDRSIVDHLRHRGLAVERR